MCLNLSQNYQLDVHIYFTYLLFRSKEIIYLCQGKKVKYQHTLGKKINTPLLRDSGVGVLQSSQPQPLQETLWLLPALLVCYLTVLF